MVDTRKPGEARNELDNATLDLYAQAGMPEKRLAQGKVVKMVLEAGKALA